MRICIYGTEEDRQMLLSAVNGSKELVFRKYKADWYDNYDALICSIKEKEYDLAIVLMNNADGMEGVIAVKSFSNGMPVIWFSNDREFGAQAYRLGAEFLSRKADDNTDTKSCP